MNDEVGAAPTAALLDEELDDGVAVLREGTAGETDPDVLHLGRMAFSEPNGDEEEVGESELGREGLGGGIVRG